MIPDTDTSDELRALILQRLHHAAGLLDGPVKPAVTTWDVADAFWRVQWRNVPGNDPGIWQLLAPASILHHQILQNGKPAGVVTAHRSPKGWMVGAYTPNRYAGAIEQANDVLAGVEGPDGRVLMLDDPAHGLGALLRVTEAGVCVAAVPFRTLDPSWPILVPCSFEDLVQRVVSLED